MHPLVGQLSIPPRRGGHVGLTKRQVRFERDEGLNFMSSLAQDNNASEEKQFRHAREPLLQLSGCVICPFVHFQGVPPTNDPLEHICHYLRSSLVL